jgi:molybdopterin converting factor small subunit
VREDGDGALGELSPNTMAITVELPAALQPYAGSNATIPLGSECRTVSDALDALFAQWPGVVDRVLDEQGALRPHVNIFVDSQSIRFARGLDSPVAATSTIVIVPAVSGG